MKYVTINAYTMGLVFKKGAYKKAITEGNHWLMPYESIQQFDMTKPFVSPVHLDILLKDESLTTQLEIVEVQDNEIVLQYENGLFRNVLTAGRYAFWKSVVNYKFVRADLSKIDITEDIAVSILTAKLGSYIRAYTVESHEKALLFINGKFERLLEGGTYYWWKNNITIHIAKIDTRQTQIELSGQEILTKDKASLRINFYAQYKVTDVVKAALENKDHEKQLYVLVQLALREFVGTMSLDELLEKKENLAPAILEALSAKTTSLGVEVLNCGIRDIILPGEMREIMNQVLVAEKKAQANIIMRREETASTRSLLNTAKLMEENEMLFKLKEMEYVEKIADKINTISVSGGGHLLEQMKAIFSPVK
jgi:regulator of protease activity HflC (stomatin/prohibitin superfamily)